MASGISDFKKRKEEEKARQAGTLAPEVDVQRCVGVLLSHHYRTLPHRRVDPRHPSLTLPVHTPTPTRCSGKLINPHNPEYITKRPWYLGESGPSLNHHAKQNGDSSLGLQEAEEILARKPKFVGRATTYRKGACENCGAMTHKKKDCLERPRSLSKSAKVSGMDIAPDEAVVDLQVRAVGISIKVVGCGA